jgi:hypothetical protein
MSHMNMKQSLASLALAAAFTAAAVPAGPALADGAASTRNIIIGGAAAAAGALILINHNKQVHARYAQDAANQAAAEAQANNAQAAYAAERQAYLHQVALNGEYRHEEAIQHSMIVKLRNQVASQQRQLRGTAQAQAPVNATATAPRVATVSYGWGAL